MDLTDYEKPLLPYLIQNTLPTIHITLIHLQTVTLYGQVQIKMLKLVRLADLLDVV